MSNDKYKMFKQFMMNELGITRDDIKEWVKESTEETISNLMNQQYEKFSLESFCIKAISSTSMFENNGRELKSSITREVADRLATLAFNKLIDKDGGVRI